MRVACGGVDGWDVRIKGTEGGVSGSVSGGILSSVFRTVPVGTLAG